jgi:oligoribonuclease NrnB/cAMP/cGMP phosphodiesterase (DHH superfamily)
MSTPPIRVFYHANCTDGFAAAFSAWFKFKDDATYHAINYGQAMPAIADGERVYFLDICPPRAALEALAARCEVVVLDHHVTSEQDMAGLSYAYFDSKRSGAMLAWRFFHPQTPAPSVIDYVQDRDLWRWALPHSREVSAAIRTHPKDFEVWLALTGPGVIGDLVTQGSAVLAAQAIEVGILVAHARLGTVAGHQVPVVNTAIHISETGEALCAAYPDAPFAATFYVGADGRERWSLRAHNGFDVSVVARLLGGGGHRAAAGFNREAAPAVVMTPEVTPC